jgi:hypothetical protein
VLQVILQALLLGAGLWFSIDLIRIRIRIQGFDDQKIKKIPGKLQLKKIGYFFDKKLSLGLHKGHTSYRRSLQPSKKNIQHFKT